MAGILGNNYANQFRVGSIYAASGARTNFLLNAAYVFITSGPAVGIRYHARSTDPITKLYVFLDDIAGTLGNITMGCTLNNEGTSATQPGSTVRATGTVTMPSAVDKWIEVTFSTPYSPAAVGEILFFVLRNTSVAPTVDYPMILNGNNTTNGFGPAIPYTTTAGFGVAGTTATELPFVVVQGGRSFGMAVMNFNGTTYPSGTTMRGMQFSPPIDVEISGWYTSAPTGAMSGLRIYDALTPPAGTPLWTFNLGSDANQLRDELAGFKTWAPVVLQGGRTYNLVQTYGSAATFTVGGVEDYASFPAVFDDLIDGFMLCAAVSDVAGSWVVRNDSYPSYQWMVSGFPMTNRANYALGI